MLKNKSKLMAYPFDGYWKDVGTIESLWEANMDLLKDDNTLNLHDEFWKIYSVNPVRPAQFIGKDAKVKNSLVVEGCTVYGEVENSVIFQGVHVGKNAVIKNSVIMTNSYIDDDVIIDKAIIGNDVVVNRGAKIGDGEKIAVVASENEINLDDEINTEKIS